MPVGSVNTWIFSSFSNWCHRYFLVFRFLQVSIPSCLSVSITVLTLLSFRSTACLTFFAQAPFRFFCPFKGFLIYILNDSCIKLRKKEKSKERSPPCYKWRIFIIFSFKIFFTFRKVFENRTKNSWLPFTWIPQLSIFFLNILLYLFFL